MQNTLKKAAVITAAAAAVLVTVLRCLQYQGYFASYAVIVLIVAALAAVFVLVLLGKGKQTAVREMSPPGRLPIAVSSLLAGGILAVLSLYDGWIWLRYQQTPPPNDHVVSSLDAGALFLTLAFGLLGGFFLIWLGISLAGGTLRRTNRLALAALAPVLWMWFRLVRYELSYASAVQVSQSFYDFVIQIFTLLFLFAFARYVSGMGEKEDAAKNHRLLPAYALSTAVLSISGSLTAVIVALTTGSGFYEAGRLAGFTDLGIGVFALCVAATLAFARPVPCPEAEEEPSGQGETAEPESDSPSPLEAGQDIPPQEPEEAMPSAEEILREMRGGPRE